MKREVLKPVFLLNHFFVILYLCSLANGMADLSIRGLVPIFLAALLLMDISYIV